MIKINYYCVLKLQVLLGDSKYNLNVKTGEISMQINYLI